MLASQKLSSLFCLRGARVLRGQLEVDSISLTGGTILRSLTTSSSLSVPHWINGEPVSTPSSTFTLAHPSTSNTVHEVSSATSEVVEKAIAAASAAFPKWRAVPPAEKRAIFLRAADLMDERKDEFIQAWNKESPLTEGWGMMNFVIAGNAMRETGALIAGIRGSIVPGSSAAPPTYITHEPLGVCYGIAPWNAAVILSSRAFLSPIAASNTAILKTSEHTPLTQYIWGSLWKDAGLPDGVLNIIHVGKNDAGSVSEMIIGDERVRSVNFTGSTPVGRIIGQMAGKHLKPAVLELGGKAPLIVCEDADVEIAANNALFGGWVHQGQVCMTTEKIIIHESIADAFVQAVQKLGNDVSQKFAVGQFTAASAERLESLVEDAVEKGAKIVTKGGMERKGNAVKPLVLDNVTPSTRLYAEESFLPVLSLHRFSTDAEAIKIANDTPFGLTSSVHSRNVGRAMKIAAQIEAGATHINGPTVADFAHVPLGGWKASGFGRFNGIEGILQFTQTKAISVHEPQMMPVG